ncbi:MAG: hypothetical protein IGR93_00500 [Hydrococcus sp. C42_A2020_068]|nr:hypothetical protein [Hydrococcus sp. C42_A2020_068]
MNKTIGAIICAGLAWFGLQSEPRAQNITIQIGGADRGAYVEGRGIAIRRGNPQPGGVVYQPGNRLHGGVVYHGTPIRPTYREKIVIYSTGNDGYNCDRQSYRSRYYRYIYLDSYGDRQIYYYRSRYWRHY